VGSRAWRGGCCLFCGQRRWQLRVLKRPGAQHTQQVVPQAVVWEVLRGGLYHLIRQPDTHNLSAKA
jgi:hypothetical protein